MLVRLRKNMVMMLLVVGFATDVPIHGLDRGAKVVNDVTLKSWIVTKACSAGRLLLAVDAFLVKSADRLREGVRARFGDRAARLVSWRAALIALLISHLIISIVRQPRRPRRIQPRVVIPGMVELDYRRPSPEEIAAYVQNIPREVLRAHRDIYFEFYRREPNYHKQDALSEARHAMLISPECPPRPEEPTWRWADWERIKAEYPLTRAGQLIRDRADPELLQQLKDLAEVRAALQYGKLAEMRYRQRVIDRERAEGVVRAEPFVLRPDGVFKEDLRDMFHYSPGNIATPFEVTMREKHPRITEVLPTFDNAFIGRLIQLCTDAAKYDPVEPLPRAHSALTRRVEEYAEPGERYERFAQSFIDLDDLLSFLSHIECSASDRRQAAVVIADAALWAIATYDGVDGEPFLGNLDRAKEAINTYLFRTYRTRCASDAEYYEIIGHIKQATIV